MDAKDVQRLREAEHRIREIAEEFGLTTTDIVFQVATSQQIMEGMSYMFPANFSHWTFGRDYERNRTIYEHTGRGLPYEQVWNMKPPKALISETNPFALNVMVIAHVFGHVDFFLENVNFEPVRPIVNRIAEEARRSAQQFYEYETEHGREAVEKLIDAAMSIMWHQHPDPIIDEDEDDEVVREQLIAMERARLSHALSNAFISKEERSRLKRESEKEIEEIKRRDPPRPRYDLLLYIIRNSDKLEPWMKSVLRVVRNQARALSPNRRTKVLNEGWATYCHLHIMRRLFNEGFLSAEDYEVFVRYHSGVIRPNPKSFNPYRIGLALFEDVEERWNTGQFGKEYEESKDPMKRSRWDNQFGKGREKIFDVRKTFSDRMAIELFFTDDFIREQQLYIYVERERRNVVYSGIVEKDPKVIRAVLKNLFTMFGAPIVTVEDGDYKGRGDLLLRHRPTGFELDPKYRAATMENIQHLWGNRIHLIATDDGDEAVYLFDGRNHTAKTMKKLPG